MMGCPKPGSLLGPVFSGPNIAIGDRRWRGKAEGTAAAICFIRAMIPEALCARTDRRPLNERSGLAAFSGCDRAWTRQKYHTARHIRHHPKRISRLNSARSIFLIATLFAFYGSYQGIVRAVGYGIAMGSDWSYSRLLLRSGLRPPAQLALFPMIPGEGRVESRCPVGLLALAQRIFDVYSLRHRCRVAATVACRRRWNCAN